jgi:hypothetical protein
VRLLRLALRTCPGRLGDQHRADADEGDPGNAPAVEIFLEEHKGKHRDGDIGQAEERIGKGQFDLGQHVKVRRHRNDESRSPAKTQGLNRIWKIRAIMVSAVKETGPSEIMPCLSISCAAALVSTVKRMKTIYFMSRSKLGLVRF